MEAGDLIRERLKTSELSNQEIHRRGGPSATVVGYVRDGLRPSPLVIEKFWVAQLITDEECVVELLATKRPRFPAKLIPLAQKLLAEETASTKASGRRGADPQRDVADLAGCLGAGP